MAVPRLNAAAANRIRRDVSSSFNRVQYELNIYAAKLRTEIAEATNLAVAKRLAENGKKTQVFKDVTGALRQSFKGVAARSKYKPSAHWRAWSARARQGFPLVSGHGPPGPRRNLSASALAKQQRRTDKNRRILTQQGRRYKRGQRGGRTPPYDFVSAVIRQSASGADGVARRIVEQRTPAALRAARAKALSKYPRTSVAVV